MVLVDPTGMRYELTNDETEALSVADDIAEALQSGGTSADDDTIESGPEIPASEIKQTLAELLEAIKLQRLLYQYAEIERMNSDEDSREFLSASKKLGEAHVALMELFGEYNRSLIYLIAQENLTVEDYMTGGVVSSGGDFLDPQDLGAYKTNMHTGLDLVGENGLITPFFTTLVGMAKTDTETNEFNLSIIGTGLNMRMCHADKDDVLGMGNLFNRKQQIVPFPEYNNGDYTTGPHIHIEIFDTKQFYDPYTLQPVDEIFQFSLDGGIEWEPRKPEKYYLQ